MQTPKKPICPVSSSLFTVGDQVVPDKGERECIRFGSGGKCECWRVEGSEGGFPGRRGSVCECLCVRAQPGYTSGLLLLDNPASKQFQLLIFKLCFKNHRDPKLRDRMQIPE
ncbi:hypothetical protein J6590_031969 [Homalodisca vitripennis]|nr:hypothetical protein J6590_031969 [Homalodisca vitripennis]